MVNRAASAPSRRRPPAAWVGAALVAGLKRVSGVQRVSGIQYGLLVGLLIASLLAGSVELHPADLDSTSRIAAARGSDQADTSAHPQRARACLEASVTVHHPPCPGCLLSLHNAGSHLAPVAAATLADNADSALVAGSAPLPRAALGAPSSRGPPLPV